MAQRALQRNAQRGAAANIASSIIDIFARSASTKGAHHLLARVSHQRRGDSISRKRRLGHAMTHNGAAANSRVARIGKRARAS